MPASPLARLVMAGGGLRQPLPQQVQRAFEADAPELLLMHGGTLQCLKGVR